MRVGHSRLVGNAAGERAKKDGEEMRKSIHKMVPLIVLFALLLYGCGESENSGGSTLPFSNYGTVLEENEEISAYACAGEAVIPARIYFNNTGSMEGFTFGEKENRKILEKRTGTLENALIIPQIQQTPQTSQIQQFVSDEQKDDDSGVKDGDGKGSGEIQSEEMKEYGEGKIGTIEGMD